MIGTVELLLLLPVLLVGLALPVGLVFAIVKLLQLSRRLAGLEARVSELESGK